MAKYNSYAGIGSRNTPRVIQRKMEDFGLLAAEAGIILRSGHAPGADMAFENGCDAGSGPKEIFLPWKGFNGSNSTYFEESCVEAYDLAKRIHPAWSRLTVPAKKLVARNMHQIMGPEFDTPVDFVVCWTPDGCESHITYGRATGGTGTAICAASMMEIPIYNFFHESRMREAFEILKC